MNQLLLVSFVLRLFLYKRFEVKSPGQKLLLTQPVSQAAGPVQPGQNYGSVYRPLEAAIRFNRLL